LWGLGREGRRWTRRGVGGKGPGGGDWADDGGEGAGARYQSLKWFAKGGGWGGRGGGGGLGVDEKGWDLSRKGSGHSQDKAGRVGLPH